MASQIDSAMAFQASAALQDELAQVHRYLVAAIDELYSPLRDLVQAQLKQAEPLARAAVVLTVALGHPDTTELREKRLYLAAALELLYVAQQIHRLLLAEVETSKEFAPDKSVLGSVILAGDYCFSRAAIWAAQTDCPAVVTILANAIKMVNEGNLRQRFAESAAVFSESQNLFEAGARAAATLITPDPALLDAAADFGRTIALPHAPIATTPTPPLDRKWLFHSSEQQARYQAFHLWLGQNAENQ